MYFSSTVASFSELYVPLTTPANNIDNSEHHTDHAHYNIYTNENNSNNNHNHRIAKSCTHTWYDRSLVSNLHAQLLRLDRISRFCKCYLRNYTILTLNIELRLKGKQRFDIIIKIHCPGEIVKNQHTAKDRTLSTTSNREYTLFITTTAESQSNNPFCLFSKQTEVAPDAHFPRLLCFTSC